MLFKPLLNIICLFSFLTIEKQPSYLIGKWKVVDFNTSKNNKVNVTISTLFGTNNFPANFLFNEKTIVLLNKKGVTLEESNYTVQNNSIVIKEGKQVVTYIFSFNHSKDTLSLKYKDFTYILVSQH